MFREGQLVYNKYFKAPNTRRVIGVTDSLIETIILKSGEVESIDKEDLLPMPNKYDVNDRVILVTGEITRLSYPIIRYDVIYYGNIIESDILCKICSN